MCWAHIFSAMMHRRFCIKRVLLHERNQNEMGWFPITIANREQKHGARKKTHQPWKQQRRRSNQKKVERRSKQKKKVGRQGKVMEYNCFIKSFCMSHGIGISDAKRSHIFCPNLLAHMKTPNKKHMETMLMHSLRCFEFKTN